MTAKVTLGSVQETRWPRLRRPVGRTAGLTNASRVGGTGTVQVRNTRAPHVQSMYNVV
jgi:hypothetical protein